MKIKVLPNIMILLGLVLFCYPLISYVGEEKAPQDALRVLTEPDAQKRLELEEQKLDQGMKESEQDGNILKEDKMQKKSSREVYLEGKQPAKEWPAR